MEGSDFLQVAIYVAALVTLAPPLGVYLAKVYSQDPLSIDAILSPLERAIYRLCHIDQHKEMNAIQYTWAVLTFSFLGFLVLFTLQLCQKYLWGNPQGLDNVEWTLALNTAMSFVTNTNWQAYAGETTLTYMTQAVGLTVQNFLSAATGMAVLVAFIRGIVRQGTPYIGNFWVDLNKSILYILLPLSCLLAILLLSQGVIQNWSAYIEAITLEGEKQLLPMGPAASQIAIKQLGTNGGGFFGANSAHPFENPTPFSNFLQMLSLLLLPASAVHMYGIMTKAKKQAWMIFGIMLALFLGALSLSLFAEFSFNPALNLNASMEGKELRFGITNSVIWSTATTAASNGAINAMHDSLSPLAGGLALLQILLGEIIFGGVGSGMYGMLLFILFTVFLAGLMVGRTPEFSGKKIEAWEIQMVLIAILAPCAVVLIGAAFSIVSPWGLKGLNNAGPHGLSEILYAWASAANNNGSAFAGLSVNTTFYNLGLSAAMCIGRFAVIIPTLLIAGSFAQKKVLSSSGSMGTDNLVFALLLSGIILLVGALTFVPALTLGPLIEHFLMKSGHLF